MNNYSVKFKSGSIVYDISDYVSDIKDVPYMMRNPDYTLIFDGYDISIPATYTNITKIEEDVRVLVYSGSVLIHNGKVKNKTYDWDKREYKVEVEHAMKDLDRVVNRKSTLNSFIAPFTQSITVNTKTNKLIKHNDLITAYFSASGYNLDWSQYYVSTSMNLISTTGYLNDANWNNILINYTPDQIYYLPEAVYCLNQSAVKSVYNIENSVTWAIDPDNLGSIIWTINPNRESIEKMVSTLEVVNILSSMYGYNYIPKDSGSFYVVASAFDTNDISIPDDEKFVYDEKIYKGQSGVKVSFTSLTLWTGKGYFNFMGYEETKNRWFPTIVAMQYYTRDEQRFNTTKDYANNDINYNNSYATGSNGKQLKWLNHLVPIAVISGTPYLIYPGLEDDNTIIRFQRESVLSSGVEKKVETFSKNVWSIPHLYQAQEIKFSDLKEDLVEIIWRENL